ncbi:unnamed protein product [Meloidogyne enterolobii]|uniref:Uncharacterized protein n=1 Tax=Meloidogyne enterolobii TaxID=390850 RepID=A0ACB0YRZ5_MELEN
MHRIQQNKPTTTIIDNISLKSNQTTQSNNQLNNSSSPSIPKRRTSGSTGGIQKRRKKENILNVPEPPPRHSSGDLVAIKEKEINKNAQLLLHSFGRPLNSEELNNKILEEEEQNNNLQIKNKKQKNINCDSPTNIVGTSTSDYLTMKPVHRAKPFKLGNEIEKGFEKINEHLF